MIRSTVNQSIRSAAKTGTRQGESYELVLAGINEASAVKTEARDFEARAAYQTTTPSNQHNGATE